ncbi:MAG: tetraacyldisaccharide 4'-kinase [Fimbriimonadaceae bacterium]|nr:tetraacyldisaccharide 4'-kinase [Fimbriimonadaceae bacterium]
MDDVRRRLWSGMGPVAWALSPLSGLYALGWWSYQAVYALGLKRAAKPHRPIVCVGNLVAGGAGKTPTTLHVLDVLMGAGHHVVVSASGYGSPHQDGAELAPPGEIDPAVWGDEPALFRLKRPDVPLVVGRDRVRAAEVVAKHYPDSVMLMDDGYQHLRVDPDVRILLDPPRANTLCLPVGPYREPRSSGRRRADAVVPPDFTWRRASTSLARPDGTPAQPEGPCCVVCALAEPGQFVADVKRLGVDVAETRLLPDHDRLDEGTLFASLPPDMPLVTTSKDWVKLRRRPVDRDVFVADYEAFVEPAPAFRAWLLAKVADARG